VLIAPLAVDKASPDGKLLLNATVVSWAPESLTMAWHAISAPPGAPALDAPGVAITPLTQRLVLLAPGALVPNSTHEFMLVASDAAGSGNGTLRVPVAARPSGVAPGAPPTLSVSLPRGTAFADSFTLSTADWAANENRSGVPPHLQLEFAFSYTNADKPAEAPVLLADYGPAPNVTFLLPAGNFTFSVAARNAYGALSDPAAPVQAYAFAALPPGLTDATELMSAVSGGAGDALASGNAAGAASLSGAMAALLNDPEATATSTLQAQHEARDNLLSTLTNATAAASSPGTLSAAAAATASVVAAGTAGLSAAGTDAAVSVLGAIASVPNVALPPAAAGSMAGAVSSLSGGSANASLLGNLAGVVDAMGSSLLSGLQAPGEAVSISSPGVQMTLQLDDPVSSSLFSAPLTAPGSAASFAPLPAAALAGAPPGAPVQTTFSALAFDPFTGGASATGVVKLAFANADGSELKVANLTTPIFFSMPALELAPGTRAQCRFWDTAAGAYSTDGCATLPNPAPAAEFLALAWQAGVQLASPAQVAAAWGASGALLAGCSEVVLDCGDAADRKRSVVLDPNNLFTQPPVGCGGATSGVLRMFGGAACALYRPDNAARCAWNTTLQAFEGDGCAAAAATQCAVRITRTSPHAPHLTRLTHLRTSRTQCTHLTSFSGEPAPKIAVCSAKDMVNLDPRDIVTKLRLLFCVVVGLFGGMHIGALVGLVQDSREKRQHLARMCAPALGFEEQANGAWTWRFEHHPLEDDSGPVPGNLQLVARIVGVPLARLRCALPEELCAGVTAQLVGRRHGLSVAALEKRNAAQLALLQLSRAGDAKEAAAAAEAEDSSGRPMDKIPGTQLPSDAALPRGTLLTRQHVSNLQVLEAGAASKLHMVEAGAAPYEVLLQHAHSTAVAQHTAHTALMLAVLSMRCILPESELAQRYLAAAEFFEADEPGGAARCVDLISKFKCMLATDNIRKSGQWLDRTRMWRFILLSHAEGWYDPSHGLAFALQSVRAAPKESSAARSAFVRCWGAVRLVVHMAVALVTAAQRRDEAFESRGRHGGDEDEELDDEQDKDAKGRGDLDEEEEAALREESGAPRDCPLTYSVLAIIRSVPRSLRAAEPCPHQARRIWTTALACAVMDSMEVCWAVNQPGFIGMSPVGDGTPETLLDRSEAWLAAQSLPPGLLDKVRAAAEFRAGEWRKVQDARITAMRAAELRSVSHVGDVVERTAGALVRALCSTHATFSVFIAPFLARALRLRAASCWQQTDAPRTPEPRAGLHPPLAVLHGAGERHAFGFGCQHLVRAPCAPGAPSGRALSSARLPGVSQDVLQQVAELLPGGARHAGLLARHHGALPGLLGRLRGPGEQLRGHRYPRGSGRAVRFRVPAVPQRRQLPRQHHPGPHQLGLQPAGARVHPELLLVRQLPRLRRQLAALGLPAPHAAGRLRLALPHGRPAAQLPAPAIRHHLGRQRLLQPAAVGGGAPHRVALRAPAAPPRAPRRARGRRGQPAGRRHADGAQDAHVQRRRRRHDVPRLGHHVLDHFYVRVAGVPADG
jgi:hypothetical protein